MSQETKNEPVKAYPRVDLLAVDVYLVTKDDANGDPKTFYKVDGSLLSEAEFEAGYVIASTKATVARGKPVSNTKYGDGAAE